MSVHTGNGATLTIGGTAVASNIASITGPTFTRSVVDTSSLGTSGDYMTSIGGDLHEIGELEFTFNWDDTSAGHEETDVLDIDGAAASVVLTFPLGGHNTAANLTGTGFVTEIKYPDFANNELQVGSGKIKFDGETGPTYTQAADA